MFSVFLCLFSAQEWNHRGSENTEVAQSNSNQDVTDASFRFTTRISIVDSGAMPRVTSFAPQFLVDDLARSIAYYQKLGFTFGESWQGFYAIGMRDGLELHLKEAPRNVGERQHRREHEHLDAAGGVDGIEEFYAQCVANGVSILRPLTETPWGTKDFYIEDPDGYIIAFGGCPSDGQAAIREVS